MKLRLLFASYVGLVLLGLVGCSGEDSFFSETEKKSLLMEDITGVLTVRTDENPVYSGSGTVTVEGYVDDEGSSRIRIKGFIYSDLTDTPTLENNVGRTRIILASQAFQSTIEGLTDGVDYYVRAYAYNSTDTAYGDPIKIITVCAPSEIITLAVENRVKRAAIVCGQFTQQGDIREYGVCLSPTPNPTLEDTYVKAVDIDQTDVVGCFGVLFDNLEPQTMYHVRAYAIQNDEKIIYGNNRIFQTTNGGNVTSDFWNGEYCLETDPAAYVRIQEAIDSALYYYNNYSNLTKHINYNYSPGTPTADCNIEGWMRFGENERYQWVGTAQHEISHAMGVGTASNWGTLIQVNGSRTWFNPKAIQALRVVMKDMTQNLYGDGTHFWPGGINQREEVTTGTQNSYGVYIRNADMLKGNAMILSAMREDGMTNY